MKAAITKLLIFFFITEGISQTIDEYEIHGNEYIVKYRNKSSYNEAHAGIMSSRTVSNYVESIESDNIDIMKIETEDELKYWEERPDILFVEPNYVAHTTAEETPYGINLVQALDVKDLGFNNSDAVSDMKVCILDTGLATHSDIPQDYIEGFGYYPVGNDYTHYIDRHGHGTHVAGTVAALGNDEGVIGVVRSQNTRLVIGKVLSDSGSGTYANIIDALTKCKDKGAKVINMSLGGGGFLQTFQDKVNELHEAGIVIVAAAGNGGSSRQGYPASYENVISVAAVDSNQNHASFSQYNEMVDLAAPGVAVKSTCIGDTYCVKSGTSMACPHVAGVLALLWSHFPYVNNTHINDVLERTAKDLGADGRDNYYGHGLVQAKAAFDQLVKETPPPPPSSPPSSPPPPSGYNFTIGKGVSNYDSSSGTVYMGHSIGHTVTNATIKLFYEDCADPLTNTQLLEVVHEEFDREKYAEDGFAFYYGIKVNTENISDGDERIVKSVNDNEGYLAFCARVTASVGTLSVNQYQTAFRLKYNLKSGVFELPSIQKDELAEAVSEQVDIVGDIKINACLCDSSFACNENLESIVLQDNSPISICLKQQTEGEKLAFKSIHLQMISSDNFLYEPVIPSTEGLEDGANALTTITVNEDTSDVLIKTYLVTELFSNTESSLTVRGTAQMDFDNDAKSDSLKQFSLQLKLRSKNEEKKGCILKNMLKMFGA